MNCNSPFSDQELSILTSLAVKAAKSAGQYQRSVDRGAIKSSLKETGHSLASQIVTQIDLQSESIIKETLSKSIHDYDLGWLGEESLINNSHDYLQKKAFWCVDPLDGTLPFVRGLEGYAVSIALVGQQGNAIIGVVYLPFYQTLMTAATGLGCQLYNARPLIINEPDKLLFLVDSSLLTASYFPNIVENLNDCADKMSLSDVEVISGAGAVANACSVLVNQNSVYLKPPKPETGGGSVWDFAATACLFDESSKYAKTYSGELLKFNNPDTTYMNHLGIIYSENKTIFDFIQNTNMAT